MYSKRVLSGGSGGVRKLGRRTPSGATNRYYTDGPTVVRATASRTVALLLAAKAREPLASGTFAAQPTNSGVKMQHRLVLGLVTLAACAGPTSTRGPTPVLLPIRADELRRDLTVFASDSFAGRA